MSRGAIEISSERHRARCIDLIDAILECNILAFHMLVQSTSTKFNRRAVSLNVGKKFMKSIELI